MRRGDSADASTFWKLVTVVEIAGRLVGIGEVDGRRHRHDKRIGAAATATALGATDVRAVHAAVDLGRASALADRWMELRVPIRLDIVECWDRNVSRALETAVLELTAADNEVTAVMPRRDFPKLRQRLLHDRTSRKIAKALGRYPHVDVATVPYFMDGVARRPGEHPPSNAEENMRAGGWR